MKNQHAFIGSFGGPEMIRIEDRSPLPEPGPGEVRVSVEASCVGTTDTVIRKGIYPLLRLPPPLTLGYDFVGRIDAAGDGVVSQKVGDRVAGLVQIGGNAHSLLCRAETLLPVPDGLPATAVAPLVLSYMTAWQMLEHLAAAKPGQRLLVQGGSGAVGTALIQLAIAKGASVVATASADKLSYLRRQGAEAVDYRAADSFARLRHLVPQGFDAAFDAIGNRSFSRSHRLLKPGGILVTYGTLAFAQRLERKTIPGFLAFGLNFAWMMSRLAWWRSFSAKRGVFFGIIDSQRDHAMRFQTDFRQLTDWLAQGKIKPHLHSVLSLDQVAVGHRLIETHQVCGSLVLDLTQPSMSAPSRIPS